MRVFGVTDMGSAYRSGGKRDPESNEDYAEDVDLVRGALAGSVSFRQRFAERMRCVPKFLAVKNARMGRPLGDDELEDLVQETLVKIWQRLDSYAGRASLQTWAYGFCHFGLTGHLRSLRRRPRNVELVDTPAPDRVEQAFADEGVMRALDRLPDRDAGIIRLRHFEQLSFDAIAERTALPYGSVKAGYYRALGRLREVLAPKREEGSL